VCKEKEVVACLCCSLSYALVPFIINYILLGNPEEDDGAQSSDEDEDKYVEKMDMPGTKVDAAERYTLLFLIILIIFVVLVISTILIVLIISKIFTILVWFFHLTEKMRKKTWQNAESKQTFQFDGENWNWTQKINKLFNFTGKLKLI